MLDAVALGARKQLPLFRWLWYHESSGQLEFDGENHRSNAKTACKAIGCFGLHDKKPQPVHSAADSKLNGGILSE